MSSAPLEQINSLVLDEEETRQLRLTSDRLLLRRAWPRATTGLRLEYLSKSNEVVAGQWNCDTAALLSILKKLKRDCPSATAAIHRSVDVHVAEGRGRGRQRQGRWGVCAH